MQIVTATYCGRRFFRWLVSALTMLVTALSIMGCGLHGHRIDFTPLERADRIEVRTRLDAPVKSITDPVQVRAALDFIKKYRSGGKDPLSGPLVPRFMLQFYTGQEGLGGFGVGSRHIVSNPPTAGFWSREVPRDEIDRLVRALALKDGPDLP